MAINNSNEDINNQFEIPLKLPKVLEESGIIHKFVIDINDKYLKLRLHSTYNLPISLDVPINIIKERDGWTKFANRFRDLRKTFKKVSEDHKDWIYITVNENGSLIRSYLNNNNNNNNSATNSSSQQQHENNQSDTSDIPDKEKDPEQEKNDKKNNENFNENGSKVVSDMSDMSDSNLESHKGFNSLHGVESTK
jgi:hypothetical protein